MGKRYIWRDLVDSNMFSLGVHSEYGYCAYAHIHIDGIYDLFGDEVLQTVNPLTPGGEPVEVVLTLAFSKTEAGR